MNHCNRNLSDSLRNRFSPEKKVRSDFAENFSEQREKIGKLGEIRLFSPPLQKQNCIVRNFFWSKMFLFHFSAKKVPKKKIIFGPKCLVSDDFDLFSVTGDRFRSSEPFEKLNHARKEILVSWLPALCRKLILGQRFLFLTRRVKVCSFIQRNGGWHLHSNFK